MLISALSQTGRKGRRRAQGVLAGTALIAILTAPAAAENIDTLPAWNGVSFISSWGVPNTATYGQTITPTAQQRVLTGFTFELQQSGGTAPQYQAFVFQWDPVGQRITGAPLYTSGILTAPSSGGFTPVTISTGSLVLATGQQYVLMFTTSTVPAQPNASYRWGALTNNTTYPGGQFVFNNNGTNFGALSTTSWSNIAEDLAFQAYLLGLLQPGLPTNAPVNPTNVANAVDKAVLGGATLPSGFSALYLLTPAQLVDALGALAGENNTQAQQGAFQLGTSYLSLLTDPFATNRVGTAGPLGFAADQAPQQHAALPKPIAQANAMYTKAPPPVVVPEPRWDVWGAAFGGANTLSGDTTGLGTHDTYTRAGGVAAGADYRLAPDSMIGFSLAGGNINWSVTGNGFGGNGGGRSDSLMAGIYGRHGWGPTYVSAALTYSNYWMATDRTVNLVAPDRLHANFDAQSWGGRIEGGYRIPGQFWAVNWTPYAAFQGQSFHTPNYGEVAAQGGTGQFALNFAARTATAYRGEVGLRSDKVWAVDSGSQLNVFGKIAYAHDEISNPALAANFTAFGIGGAPFTVFGARPSRDLALTTAGAEWRLDTGVSFLVKFDGEFGDRSQTYSGTGRIRYTW